MKFTGFQNLYQQVKTYDLRLFDCLRIIENYIQQLVSLTPSAEQQSPVVSFQSGVLALTNVYQLVPGLSIVLPTEGTWYIELNNLVSSDPADAFVQELMYHGAASKNVAGGQPADDSLFISTIAMPALVQIQSSKSWIYTSGHQNDIIQIQAKKGAGAGVSAINNLDGVGNKCSSLKAIYLGNYVN